MLVWSCAELFNYHKFTSISLVTMVAGMPAGTQALTKFAKASNTPLEIISCCVA